MGNLIQIFPLNSKHDLGCISSVLGTITFNIDHRYKNIKAPPVCWGNFGCRDAQSRERLGGEARASLMILRVGYEDHPMKVKVLLQLKLGTLNISSHTWWTDIACSRRERWRSSLAKMAISSDASRVMLSSVADRSADSGTNSAVVRRDDNWISWRGPRHTGGRTKRWRFSGQA